MTEVVATIRDLYENGGEYGVLTQLQHSLQCANLARTSGADDATVVAALLHDIGWMLAARGGGGAALEEELCEGAGAISNARPSADCLAARLGILAQCKVSADASDEQLRAQHDVIGATYLRMVGFDERVPHLVEGHVLAKRYLTAVDPTYHDKLSAASKRTLVFQGGPMDPEEIEAADRDPAFASCKQLRLWDEGAKVPGLEVPDYDAYVPAIRACLTRPPRDATRCSDETFFLRDGNRIVGVRGG